MAFSCSEKICSGGSFGGFRGVSAGNFRGGHKPFPKPSAFESEIHPKHKPDGLCFGDFALPGANLRLRKFTVRKSQTVFLHAAPKDGAHGCCCCRRLHFGANTQQHLRDFAKKSLCGCQKAATVNCPDTGMGLQ